MTDFLTKKIYISLIIIIIKHFIYDIKIILNSCGFEPSLLITNTLLYYRPSLSATRVLKPNLTYPISTLPTLFFAPRIFILIEVSS